MVAVSDDSDGDEDEAENLPVVDSPIETEEKSYLEDAARECPKHGTVIPVALPYIVSRKHDTADYDYEQPDGYHLVCPRCRHAFEEYEVTRQQWSNR